MKINLGAGDNKIDGFISCDFDRRSNPDYCFDLEKDVFPFPDNSVEVVVAHHVLEHLGEGYFHCLKEIYRVCKHGALIHIRVPHHRNEIFWNDPTHRRPITVDGLLLFSKKYNRWCEDAKNSASRLGYYYDVDFELEQYEYIPSEGYAIEFEGKPKEEVQKYINEHCNIVKEIVIRLMVIKNYE